MLSPSLRSHVPGTLGTWYRNMERGTSICEIMVRRGYTYFVCSNQRWNTFLLQWERRSRNVGWEREHSSLDPGSRPVDGQEPRERRNRASKNDGPPNFNSLTKPASDSCLASDTSVICDRRLSRQMNHRVAAPSSSLGN
jgi:hypothetical protein